MSVGSRASGRRWELAVAGYLRAHGLEVMELGYQCRLGELDLICRERETLVIVEVRARSRRARGSALETVDWRKRRKLVRATRYYLMRHPEWLERAMRFDVVAIDAIDTPVPRLTWIKNAFDGS
jgi:putative endonuclease